MSEILYCQQSPPCAESALWSSCGDVIGSIECLYSPACVPARSRGHSIISPLSRAGDLRRPATTRAGNEPSRSLKLPTSAFVLVSLVCQFKIYLPLTVGGLTHSFSIMS